MLKNIFWIKIDCFYSTYKWKMNLTKIIILVPIVSSMLFLYWCGSDTQTTNDITFPSIATEDTVLLTWEDETEKFWTASFDFRWYIDYKSWDMNIIWTWDYSIPWRYLNNSSYWWDSSVEPWYSQQQYWYDYSNCSVNSCYDTRTTYIYTPSTSQ